jgi:hypothetical protein
MLRIGHYLRTQMMGRGKPVEIDLEDVSEKRLSVGVKLKYDRGVFGERRAASAAGDIFGERMLAGETFELDSSGLVY